MTTDVFLRERERDIDRDKLGFSNCGATYIYVLFYLGFPLLLRTLVMVKRIYRWKKDDSYIYIKNKGWRLYVCTLYMEGMRIHKSKDVGTCTLYNVYGRKEE